MIKMKSPPFQEKYHIYAFRNNLFPLSELTFIYPCKKCIVKMCCSQACREGHKYQNFVMYILGLHNRLKFFIVRFKYEISCIFKRDRW